MKIEVAKRAGFCFGVKRAVEIAFKKANSEKGKVCTYGPIIHNPQVVGKLEQSGVYAVGSIQELKKSKASALIIRTHGITREEMRSLGNLKLEVVDATCPFVKKAQYYAKLLRDEGYRVIIVGDRDHPEVRGLLSYAGKDAVVVNNAQAVPPIRGKVGVVVQTTQPIETLKSVLNAIIDNTKELKVYNTICNSTALRLRETEDIAKSSDIMIVVGGKNSANTTQLANLCRSLSVPTYHIETALEMKPSWLKSRKSVGITAGASTPVWLIKEAVNRIISIGGDHRDGITKRRTRKTI